MGKTSISWTGYTHQTVYGCSLASPGCASCYAMSLVGTRLSHLPAYAGLTTRGPNGPVWNGSSRPAPVERLLEPLGWREPRTIFLNSMSDLFGEAVHDDWIHYTFAMCAMAPQHRFQILTKRSRRMMEYSNSPDTHKMMLQAAARLATLNKLARARYVSTVIEWPLPNVVLGVSVEDRARVSRIDDLRNARAHARFVSFEPLLEPLGPLNLDGIDLAIVGGESKTSGRAPRPLPIEAVYEIRSQCATAGCEFHFKQVGSNHQGWPGNITGKGDKPDEWPEDLRNPEPTRALELA